MTYKQRKTEQKLREEMRERIQKGEKNLRIRNGQLVQRIDVKTQEEGRKGREEGSFRERNQ